MEGQAFLLCGALSSESQDNCPMIVIENLFQRVHPPIEPHPLVIREVHVFVFVMPTVNLGIGDQQVSESHLRKCLRPIFRL